MIKLALIGLGSMGKNHYRVMQNIKGIKIVALCDIQNNNSYCEAFYTDVDKMLKEVNFDAAIIAVPTFLHKQIALKCLFYNKHLFIEKPIASSINEAKEIQKIASKKNIKVCVGHVERFNPVVLALKNELQNTDIYSINITRVGPLPSRIADVGVLTDLSVHDIDLIRFISEKEIIKTAIFKSQKIHNSHEDNAILSFKLKSDIVASITTNWLTPFRKRTIEVATKQAYYEADLLQQNLTQYSSYEQNFSYVLKNCLVEKAEPLKLELNAFKDYILTNNPSNLCNIKDAIKTLEIASSQAF